mgnify:CR=1 FL=1
MASINLKHTSGNGTILNSPAANPSADITLKLPSTTGSAGQVLQVASANHSSTNAELEFAAAGGGKLVQMKYKNSNTEVSSTSSSSYTLATDLSLEITPTSGSNLILGMFTIYILGYSNGNAESNSEVMVTDDDQSTYLIQQRMRAYNYAGSGIMQSAVMGGNHVKTAGNTNARTYKVGIKNQVGSGNAWGTILNPSVSNNSYRQSSVVLMEIEP